MRGYIPVIVRGEEDKGVRIWPFSPKIYKRLYAMLIDADIGDFTDPMEGRDLKVSVVKNPKNKYPDVTVDPTMKQSPLSKDKQQIKTWLDTVPDLDEKLQKLMSYDELQKALDDWLNGAEKAKSDGTEPIQERLGVVGGLSDDDEGSTPSSAMAELDDAFADLEDKE